MSQEHSGEQSEGLSGAETRSSRGPVWKPGSPATAPRCAPRPPPHDAAAHHSRRSGPQPRGHRSREGHECSGDTGRRRVAKPARSSPGAIPEASPPGFLPHFSALEDGNPKVLFTFPKQRHCLSLQLQPTFWGSAAPVSTNHLESP